MIFLVKITLVSTCFIEILPRAAAANWHQMSNSEKKPWSRRKWHENNVNFMRLMKSKERIPSSKSSSSSVLLAFVVLE